MPWYTNTFGTEDPTDTGDPAQMTPATHDALADLQRAYGICSEGDCEQPIWHWCATCGSKLCYRHHRAHERDHLEAATTIPALPVATPDACRFCGQRFTDPSQYYTDQAGPYCREGRGCLERSGPLTRVTDDGEAARDA